MLKLAISNQSLKNNECLHVGIVGVGFAAIPVRHVLPDPFVQMVLLVPIPQCSIAPPIFPTNVADNFFIGPFMFEPNHQILKFSPNFKNVNFRT